MVAVPTNQSINQSINSIDYSKNNHLQKWPVVYNICLKAKIKPKDIYKFLKNKLLH